MKNFTAFLAVSIVLLVSVPGCKFLGLGSDSDTATNNSTNQSNGAQTASKGGEFTSSGDALADLKNASKRFTEADAFQAKMESTGDQPMQMEVAYVAPDRYQIKNAAIESIIIGKDTYIKLNGKWNKFPQRLDKTIPTMRDMFTEEGLKSLKDVEFTGEDSVNGRDTLVYSYKGAVPQTNNTYDSKLWIAKDDGLPIKIEVEYSGGPLKKMTTVYKYSPDVAIEAPIKK